MPFVHVRSLPLSSPFEVETAVRAISSEFASASETDEQHVTVTWQTIEPGQYSHAGRTASAQQSDTHPLLVEVVAPDVHPAPRIERMLEAASRAVASAAGVPLESVFVEFRPAHSGHVLDGGRVMRW